MTWSKTHLSATGGTCFRSARLLRTSSAPPLGAFRGSSTESCRPAPRSRRRRARKKHGKPKPGLHATKATDLDVQLGNVLGFLERLQTEHGDAHDVLDAERDDSAPAPTSAACSEFRGAARWRPGHWAYHDLPLLNYRPAHRRERPLEVQRQQR